jgi:peptidyl-prolyl cis-trans isomerase B (cyclophilin B)
MIILNTNKGVIQIELDHENTPETANNFVNLVKEKYYDGTIFHRVIDGFMVQGGGFNPGMTAKDNKGSIMNEANNGQANNRGTLAMARTSDPHSASSQFFINTVDNKFLNFKAENQAGWGYCVFGHVTQGMDVVDAIQKTKTGNMAGHQDVPTEEILIETAIIQEA